MGVLTALTFSAVIFLTGREKAEHPEVEATLTLFVAAFVSMLLATYLFTDASAEEHALARGAFETFCASLAFAAALLPLFLGIAHIMRDRGFDGVRRFASGLVLWLIGPAIFGFLSSTAVNAHGVNAGEGETWDSLLGYLCGGMWLLLVVWIAFGPTWSLTKRAQDRWTAFTVGITGLAAFLDGLWGEVAHNHSFPAGAYLVLMVLLLVAALGYSSALKGLNDADEASPSSESISAG